MQTAWRHQDLRTRTEQLDAKEKARRKKSDARFSTATRNRVFRKNTFEHWCEEAVWDGNDRGEDQPLACRFLKV